MQRRFRRLAPLALAASLGCQDYNFSPVAHCLIQPGTERVTLSDISTADVLFVVDDSGSMGGKQVKLSESFAAFVANLQAANVARVAANLVPIDFHVAITTTSLFVIWPTNSTCSAACAGAVGSQVCCDVDSQQPLLVPRDCAADADCAGIAGGTFTCQTTCTGLAGESACCDAAGTPGLVPQPCPVVGGACGSLQKHYQFTRGFQGCTAGATPSPCATGYTCTAGCEGLSGSYCCSGGIAQTTLSCVPGVATEGALYPSGDFVRAGANPRVLHFDKGLFCTWDPTTGACTGSGVDQAAIDALIAEFQQNVLVGTCGSGEEQPLQAARLAVEKALRLNGLSQPADVLPSDWPHANSKLVVVLLTDEDDCSSPEDPSTGIIMTFPPALDACVADGLLPAAQQRRYPVQQYADFFAGLSRPFAGGFIASMAANDCADASCQPATCLDTTCQPPPGVDPATFDPSLECGGQTPSVRLYDTAQSFQGRGADTVLGSICDPGTTAAPGFSDALGRVAEVVKQPAGLQIPTVPASAQLVILRIVTPSGATRKTCVGPAPATLTEAQAIAQSYDWWFTDGSGTNVNPTGPSQYIYINQATLSCTANPGETYSADYLGLVPASGCSATDPAGQGKIDCQQALGGNVSDWTCAVAPGATRGTCLCGTATP